MIHCINFWWFSKSMIDMFTECLRNISVKKRNIAVCFLLTPWCIFACKLVGHQYRISILIKVAFSVKNGADFLIMAIWLFRKEDMQKETNKIIIVFLKDNLSIKKFYIKKRKVFIVVLQLFTWIKRARCYSLKMRLLKRKREITL